MIPGLNLIRNAWDFATLLADELLQRVGPAPEVVDAVTLPGLPADPGAAVTELPRGRS